jgi:signal transduction histidine kinase
VSVSSERKISAALASSTPAAPAAQAAPPTASSAADDLSRLLAFLYRCPVGIIEALASGEILLINAYASQILMPLVQGGGLANLLDVLAPWTDEVRALLAGFPGDRGVVCSGQRVRLHGLKDAEDRPMFLSFTIHKMESDRFMVSFFDVTERVAQERAINEAIEIHAHQAGRIELASTILHDIGNAITGLGTTIGHLVNEPQWPEVAALSRMVQLFRGNAKALSQALGAGKGEALVDYTEALLTALDERESQWRELAQRLSKSLYHVQEILTIQRQFTPDGVTVAAQALALNDLVQDALTLTEAGLSKRGVRVKVSVPNGMAISVDRTRMIQVLVNLLKNAEESFDAIDQAQEDRRIEIDAHATGGGQVRLRIGDNGVGFEPSRADELFTRGTTTKPRGGGLGLYTSRSTVEAYGGTISIASPGPGQGATITIALPASAEQGHP